jgi:hypothetical protein
LPGNKQTRHGRERAHESVGDGGTAHLLADEDEQRHTGTVAAVTSACR